MNKTYQILADIIVVTVIFLVLNLLFTLLVACINLSFYPYYEALFIDTTFDGMMARICVLAFNVFGYSKLLHFMITSNK